MGWWAGLSVMHELDDPIEVDALCEAATPCSLKAKASIPTGDYQDDKSHRHLPAERTPGCPELHPGDRFSSRRHAQDNFLTTPNPTACISWMILSVDRAVSPTI
jgi:hypothetical protein